MAGFILETGQGLERVEIFQQDDGWYYGFARDPGASFNGDPIGPFDTMQEAYNDASASYHDLPEWDELVRRNIVD